MYFITISNGLLEGNHQKRMGAAVWQYMWLIDKITKIDDDEKGWVLGGKPIQLKDFGGKHATTVSNNLAKLEKEKYIETLRTPYGLVIKVLKAKKRFSGNAKTGKERDLAKALNPISDNAKSPRENAKSNKTVSVDKVVDSTAQGAEVNEFISLFEEVNPSFDRFFARKNQRDAAARLLRKYPIEKWRAGMVLVVKANGSRYGPTITSPVELEDRFGKLLAWARKEQTPTKGKEIIGLEHLQK